MRKIFFIFKLPLIFSNILVRSLFAILFNNALFILLIKLRLVGFGKNCKFLNVCSIFIGVLCHSQSIPVHHIISLTIFCTRNRDICISMVTMLEQPCLIIKKKRTRKDLLTLEAPR